MCIHITYIDEDREGERERGLLEKGVSLTETILRRTTTKMIRRLNNTIYRLGLTAL